jgi:hypothetical protein
MIDAPECAGCLHAFRSRGPEVLCRLSPALYSCAEERSMSWFKARVYNACGRDGRFFVPLTDAASASGLSSRTHTTTGEVTA